MAADKPVKLTELDMIVRWGWFFVLYFVLILLIGSFGLVAEF
jgi:hypothetical protein